MSDPHEEERERFQHERGDASEPAGDDEHDAQAKNALLRWRLALGPVAEAVGPSFSLEALRSFAPQLDIEPSRIAALDDALSFAYEDRGPELGASRPHLPSWLAAVRGFFRRDVVALLQRDAMARTGYRELLFEPETLMLLERNVELAAALVAAHGLVPDRARDAVRAIVGEVVERVRNELEQGVRAAVFGAARRRARGPRRPARSIDWKRTIHDNLRGWDAARRRLVPERLYFLQAQHPRRSWDLVILLDQSGSMAESVVYGAVMAAIFASVDVLRTRLLFFDTEVVDVTPLLDDPVELVMSARLGGGTDLHHAVAHAADHVIARPASTLLVVVSDLAEGGDGAALCARVRRLVDDHVTVLCVLALSDERGTPVYDHAMAAELAALGVACMACSPGDLADVLARVMRAGGAATSIAL